MDKPKNARNENFFDMISAWLISLPRDIVILIKMIGDDELNINARSLAAGTLLYILSPIDLIPEKLPLVGYVDDIIILRIALALILEIDVDRAVYYREKYPETFETLSQQTELLKETLGALYSWLQVLVENLRKRRYKGQSTEGVASSKTTQEEIFDEAMEYAANINVDPKAIKNGLLATPPTHIIELLSSGLEEEQKRQVKEEEKQDQKRVIERLSHSLTDFRKQLGFGGQE